VQLDPACSPLLLAWHRIPDASRASGVPACGSRIGPPSMLSPRALEIAGFLVRADASEIADSGKHQCPRVLKSCRCRQAGRGADVSVTQR